MNYSRIKNKLLSSETAVFLCLTLLSVAVLFKYVDLTPHVDNDFFFSSNDPDYQADIEISKLFERKDNQLIISVTGDIFSREYQEKISYFTDILSSYESVTSVKSISSGPRNFDDALRSPLWRRALIAEDQKSTNVLVILDDAETAPLIPKVEDLTSALNSEDFRIKTSGFPYIVELIRRHLVVDLNVFSMLAFALFSIIVVLIFHSLRVLLGMIITCINAGAITFMINQLLDIKIGILTANLATITFVLTLSHIVFLTFNWKHLYHPGSTIDRDTAVKEAVALTISASFWSMFTTFLGFISLLFVQAKPLRELGIGGSIGTVVAFVVAYSIYPSFLRLKRLSSDWHDKQMTSFYHRTFRFFDKNYSTLIVLIMVLILFTSPKLWTLDTDPSLLSFFNKKGEIYEGLDYIDRNGGSSPLVVVLKDDQEQTLNTKRIFGRLMRLQEDLENHPDVGTILSLPLLFAEGQRTPFSFLVSAESLLERMGQKEHDHIAASFITKDRQYGLFLLRMKEQGRSSHRLEVIDQIKDIISQHHFTPHLFGGIYALQGRLSQHISTSLIYGLGRLILAFAVIAFVVSRSLRIGLSMTFSISIVPICILGTIGYFKIPLDTISAPAANVAIAMGIDAMIHMVHAYRRIQCEAEHVLDDWLKVRRRLWEPIITAMFIICGGFGIFFFSSFPPTQRFGGAIVFGTVISATTALFIFPLLAKKHKQVKRA